MFAIPTCHTRKTPKEKLIWTNHWFSRAMPGSFRQGYVGYVPGSPSYDYFCNGFSVKTIVFVWVAAHSNQSNYLLETKNPRYVWVVSGFPVWWVPCFLVHLQDEGCCNPPRQWPWEEKMTDMTDIEKKYPRIFHMENKNIEIYQKTIEIHTLWINMFDVWMKTQPFGKKLQPEIWDGWHGGMRFVDIPTSSGTHRFKQHSNCVLNKLETQVPRSLDTKWNDLWIPAHSTLYSYTVNKYVHYISTIIYIIYISTIMYLHIFNVPHMFWPLVHFNILVFDVETDLIVLWLKNLHVLSNGNRSLQVVACNHDLGCHENNGMLQMTIHLLESLYIRDQKMNMGFSTLNVKQRIIASSSYQCYEWWRNPGKASFLYPNVSNVLLLGLMCSQVVQDVFHHLYQYTSYAWFARVKHLREKGMVGRVIARCKPEPSGRFHANSKGTCCRAERETCNYRYIGKYVYIYTYNIQ